MSKADWKQMEKDEAEYMQTTKSARAKLTTEQLKAIFPNATEAFIAENASDHIKPLPAPEKPATRPPEAKESELQGHAQKYLRQRGYLPATATMAEMEAHSRMANGWYIHLAEPRGNPLLPDLLVLDFTMAKCIAIELKVRNKYQPGQREFIAIGAWHEARSLDDVKAILDAWEQPAR